MSPDDRAAIPALKVAPPQRAGIEQAVIERRKRLGWIVFVDSIDPDGDTVAVEASGPTQPIVLTKSWTPVAVALAMGLRKRRARPPTTINTKRKPARYGLPFPTSTKGAQTLGCACSLPRAARAEIERRSASAGPMPG